MAISIRPCRPANRPLHQATENRNYYLKQVIRFEKATTGVMVERQEIVSQDGEE